MTENLAIYIHWPYCRSKCPYCDFNSHVAATIDHAAWRATYKTELAHYAALMSRRRITSVFFGGGTPSLMETATVETILHDVAKLWPMAEDVEITLEANPNSAEAEKFADLKRAGVNRVSLGVQSLRNGALQFLGRAHDADEARRAVALAARHFSRFSFDLIYARKDQTIAAWEAELREALALAGEHLSLYQLTIEPTTQFHTRHARGEELTAPDNEAAHMYELTQEILSGAGLPAYEVSNHARPGAESRHNLAYWRYEDYIGIGPGAHGRYCCDGKRHATEAHRAPDVWLAQVKEKNHGLRLKEEINSETAQQEALIMGLRLTEGIAHETWRHKFGTTLAGDNSAFLSSEKISHLEKEGYLEKNPQSLKATTAGLQRLNAVLGYLVN